MMGLNYEKANHANTLYHEIYTTYFVTIKFKV